MPDLGVGVGLRRPHAAHIVDHTPDMDWFEVLSENVMVDGGRPLEVLEAVAARYPVVPHGVSLNLGGAADPEHNDRLRGLLRRLDPPWFSDHLCFTGAHTQVHDLLPLPYVPQVRDHVAERIRRIQGESSVLFAVENVSSYLGYRESQIPEWTFLGQVAEAADCAILLDLNNVYVSARNHGFDPVDYLEALPLDRVVQLHLAGHSQRDGYLLDTHDHPVCDEVWDLYRLAIERLGPLTTLIEWDDHIPDWQTLAAEAQTARTVRNSVSP